MTVSTLSSGVAHQLGKWANSAGVCLALSLITVYRLVISPVLGPRCRFYPSCSEYGAQAFERFGLVKGLWLTIRRLGRCHPFHAGGIDPVPECAAESALAEPVSNGPGQMKRLSCLCCLPSPRE